MENFTKTLQIAGLNDLARKHIGIKSRAIMTPGISALPQQTVVNILEKVTMFDDFTEDNDPYQERDFGSFKIEDNSVFWKIDYYAPDLKHGSEDPTDEEKTVRVLTIMLADEY